MPTVPYFLAVGRRKKVTVLRIYNGTAQEKRNMEKKEEAKTLPVSHSKAHGGHFVVLASFFLFLDRIQILRRAMQTRHVACSHRPLIAAFPQLCVSSDIYDNEGSLGTAIGKTIQTRKYAIRTVLLLCSRKMLLIVFLHGA